MMMIMMIAYAQSGRSNIRSRIFQIVLSKGLAVKDSKGIHNELLKDKQLNDRLSMYQKYSNAISKIPTMQCESKLKFAIELASATECSTEEDFIMMDERINQELLRLYQSANECIDIHEEIVEYIKKLSDKSEKEFVIGTVSMFKSASRKLADSIEDTPINRLRMNAYKITENYMCNRILELQDNGAITLLSTLYSIDKPSYNTIIGVKLEESMDKIKMNFTVDDGR